MADFDVRNVKQLTEVLPQVQNGDRIIITMSDQCDFIFLIEAESEGDEDVNTCRTYN